MEFSFFLTDTRRVVCKSQFCFLKEFRRKHSSLPSMNTKNRIKAIRSCFENWTMRCILCPMNTVSLSFFRSSQQFQCSRQSASAEPQCGFYKKWTCRLFIMFLIWKSWVSQWRELFLFQCQCHAPESKSKHLQIVKFVWFNCRSGHFLLYGKGSLLSTRMTINWPCS